MANSIVKTLIIIPARSGSKGLPDKNIKLLGGKPLIYWTARAINKANLNNAFAVLSTDSNHYAKVGKECGLESHFLRPPELSRDQSSAIEVINHSLQCFENIYGYQPKLVMWLQPTSPFRTAEHINQALELIQQENTDSVIGCQQIFRDESTLFHLQLDYLSALSDKQKVQHRRQEVPCLLTPNGSMYLIKTHLFNQLQSFYPPNTVPLICDKIASIDIDNEQDWFIAESIINNDVLND